MRVLPTYRARRGFTLVELAVAITIIGILIGGVIKGQEMLNNARILDVVRQLESTKAAYIGFIDKYKQIPGDMTTATRRIPDCGPNFDSAGNWCADGNGSGWIGMESSPLPIGIALQENIQYSLTNNFFMTPSIEFREHALFWKHLALTDIITGIDPSANIDDTDPNNEIRWGTSNPSIQFSGGLHAGFRNSTALISAVPASQEWKLRLPSGNQIALRKSVEGANPVSTYGGLTNRIVLRIDRKIDDGMLFSGLFSDYNESCIQDADNPTNPPENLDQDCGFPMYYLH